MPPPSSDAALPAGQSTVRHLYVHIPFCPRKCEYCAFVTHVGSLKLVDAYLGALQIEMCRLAQRRAGGPLETVYLGGGTPSLLAPEQVQGLLDGVRRRFGIAEGAEVTLEAHPAAVTAERLRGYRAAGVTRISVGVESMQPDELEALGRPHDPDVARQALHAVLRSGFTSVAADLMYGIPRQSLRSWRATLERVASSGVRHLSLYPLMIEPKTVFARRARRRELDVPADDEVIEMYHLACEVLRSAGFEHYEVASWCRPGHASRHNLAYWHDREYFAVGAGAHGYLHPHRTENIRGTSRYIRAVLAGQSPVAHVERLGADEQRVESVMLRLRLLEEGLDVEEMRRLYGIDMLSRYDEDLSRLTAAGLIRVAGTRLTLTESGVPVANEIWERLVA